MVWHQHHHHHQDWQRFAYFHRSKVSAYPLPYSFYAQLKKSRKSLQLLNHATLLSCIALKSTGRLFLFSAWRMEHVEVLTGFLVRAFILSSARKLAYQQTRSSCLKSNTRGSFQLNRKVIEKYFNQANAAPRRGFEASSNYRTNISDTRESSRRRRIAKKAGCICVSLSKESCKALCFSLRVPCS